METIKFGFIGAGKVGFSLGKYLKENNINVIKFEMKKPSLNDIFIEKVGK